jgi:NAD(P)-dependent dehydrogenase (short-subunit alcohol dehydrogenase family)
MAGNDGRAGKDVARRAIFISGAGAGIGRTAAELFAGHGWFVGLYDVDTAAVARLRAELGDGNALDGQLDVTNPGSWHRALEAFWKAAGERLDVLFNNAGIIAPGPFHEVSAEAHARVMDVNINGVLYGSHAAYDYLRKTAGARVINMASASAIYGQPDIASYSASKFAVRGLTEALDLEWRKDGIRVMSIWPLWVKTALADAASGTKTTSSLGVRLTPLDVAEMVWRAANYDGAVPRTHWLVGWQTQVLASAARLGPAAVTRWAVGRLSGS